MEKSLMEILEKLARIEERIANIKEDMQELKDAHNITKKDIEGIKRKLYLLTAILTAGMSVVYEVIKQKIRVLFN